MPISPITVENGAKYELVGPDGTRAVFNDRLDPDFVGYLAGDDGVTGLERAGVRESSDPLTDADGGIHGAFRYDRLAFTLKGTVSVEPGPDDYSVVKRTAATNLVTNPSFEVNTTGWAGEGSSGTQTVFARQTGWAKHGTASLRVTATGVVNGGYRAAAIAAIPCVQGEPFFGRATIKLAAALAAPGATFAVMPEFFGPGGYLGNGGAVSSGFSATGTANSVDVVSTVGIAPATATSVRLIVVVYNSTGATTGLDFYVDCAALIRSPVNTVPWFDGSLYPVDNEPLANLLPAGSFEDGTLTGWVPSGGWTVSDEWARYGSRSARLVAGGPASMTSTPLSPVVAGRTYTLRAAFNVLVATGAANLYVYVQWFDAGSTYMSDGGATSTATLVGEREESVNVTAPAGAAFARVVIFANGTGSNGYLDGFVDGVALVEGANMPYVNGEAFPPVPARPYATAWTGTAHASTSTLSTVSYRFDDELELRNRRVGKLMAATDAMRDDAELLWTPSGYPAGVRVLFRQQQPTRITARRPKAFLVAGVSERNAIEAADAITTNIGPAGGIITNVGSSEAWPILIIRAECQNPTVRLGAPGGPELTLIMSLGPGTSMYIDTDPRKRIVRTGATPAGSNWYHVLDSASTWWSLKPGANTIELEADVEGAGFSVDVVYRPAWG